MLKMDVSNGVLRRRAYKIPMRDWSFGRRRVFIQIATKGVRAERMNFCINFIKRTISQIGSPLRCWQMRVLPCHKRYKKTIDWFSRTCAKLVNEFRGEDYQKKTHKDMELCVPTPGFDMTVEQKVKVSR